MIPLIDVSFNIVMFYLKAPNKFAVIHDMIRNGCKDFKGFILLKSLFTTGETRRSNVREA